MNPSDRPPELECLGGGSAESGAELLLPLLAAAGRRPLPRDSGVDRIHGVVIGELLALTIERSEPLVIFPGQANAAAQLARTSVDLHGAHVGRAVVLVFERGDPRLPIVVGVLQGAGWPEPEGRGQVEVDADGQRLIVNATEQLVLRCGKASITLTKAGKVLIEGTYLLSRSTGVNRVKGGSVHLN
jgi:hypothetical protein